LGRQTDFIGTLVKQTCTAQESLESL